MKYFLPFTLAAAGAAMLIHYKNGEAVKTAAVLPPTPRMTSTRMRLASSDSSNSLNQFATNNPAAPINPKKFKQGVITAKTQAVFDKPYDFFHNRLLVLRQCLQTQNCPYPNRDPKEYEIAVNAEAKTTLETLTTWQKRHHLQDARITDLMIDYLGFEDAGVKQQAIGLLATQPADGEVLDPLLTDVIQYPQPEAIPDAMKELRRYNTSDERAKIDGVLELVLRQGAVNSAEAIAKDLKPLITRDNWNRYDKIRDDLARSPLSEDIYGALSDALDN